MCNGHRWQKDAIAGPRQPNGNTKSAHSVSTAAVQTCNRMTINCKSFCKFCEGPYKIETCCKSHEHSQHECCKFCQLQPSWRMCDKQHNLLPIVTAVSETGCHQLKIISCISLSVSEMHLCNAIPECHLT